VILIVDYGIGNLRSAEKALQHSGAEAALVADPNRISEASAIVLPGVGSFGRCVDALDQSGWREPLLEAVTAGTPFLGICVGFQMLYQGSQESPDHQGLGLIAQRVHRLEHAPKLPHIQWNRLAVSRPSTLLPDGIGDQWMYFVHSFGAPLSNETTSTAEYGEEFTASVEFENVMGVQFHPEKSGVQGLELLARFARLGALS
jgi:glutamine amidotransferase